MKIFWRIPKNTDAAEINHVIELLRVDDVSKYDDLTRPHGDVTISEKKDDDVRLDSSPEKVMDSRFDKKN